MKQIFKGYSRKYMIQKINQKNTKKQMMKHQLCGVEESKVDADAVSELSPYGVENVKDLEALAATYEFLEAFPMRTWQMRSVQIFPYTCG